MTLNATSSSPTWAYVVGLSSNSSLETRGRPSCILWTLLHSGRLGSPPVAGQPIAPVTRQAGSAASRIHGSQRQASLTPAGCPIQTRPGQSVCTTFRKTSNPGVELQAARSSTCCDATHLEAEERTAARPGAGQLAFSSAGGPSRRRPTLHNLSPKGALRLAVFNDRIPPTSPGRIAERQEEA